MQVMVSIQWFPFVDLISAYYLCLKRSSNVDTLGLEFSIYLLLSADLLLFFSFLSALLCTWTWKSLTCYRTRRPKRETSRNHSFEALICVLSDCIRDCRSLLPVMFQSDLQATLLNSSYIWYS